MFSYLMESVQCVKAVKNVSRSKEHDACSSSSTGMLEMYSSDMILLRKLVSGMRGQSRKDHTMLSTRLKTLGHPSHSHATCGLCLDSCLWRSFLSENPPLVACGHPS